MGAAPKHVEVVKKEVGVSKYIPYTSQVTKNVIKLGDSGDYMLVIRMQGAAHESADAQDINIWHTQLNQFLRNIASTNVAIWSHVVRRNVDDFPDGYFSPGFAHDLNRKYREAISAENMLINELYLSIIYRPQPIKALNFLDIFNSTSKAELCEKQLDELEALNDVVMTAMSALDRYEPEILSCYEHKGVMFSETLEFLAFLVNGEWRRVAVPRAEIRDVLATSRPFFGKGGLLSLKTPTAVQFGAILAIEEFPAITCPGLMNDLLSTPFELVLSQSFTFLSKQVAKGRMSRQQARMVNAGDVAQSQIEAIDDALDDLISNYFVMGAHSLSLFIKANDTKKLNENVADAGGVLSDSGIKWVREDTALAGAFYSQLPGNFAYRVCPGDTTSKNFSGFSSFHNFPSGRIRNNQWGDAVTMFKTTSGSPYYFNFHKGEEGADAKKAAKLDPNHKDLANMVVFGKSGTGKTVLETFLLAQAQKFSTFPADFGGVKQLTCVLFDKDLGASIAVRAMGGKYYPIKNGVPSGFNPFRMAPTPSNLSFLENLIVHLVSRKGEELLPSERKRIHEAVSAVMTATEHKRRIGAVLEFFDDGEKDGLNARLARWCRGGALHWLFDNSEDTLSLDDCTMVGFDVTDFLENPETRTPTILYLFHRVKTLMDGRRIPIFMDEFPTLLNDPAFEDLANRELVTIRKKDGFLVLFCQFPKQIFNSSIASAIVSQTATKIFLPNPEADFDDYVNGLKLTVREYEIVKTLGEKSRRFLIKQGGNSVVAELNLRGFDDELAVLSGNTATSALVEQLVVKHGAAPDKWLPEFHRIRKGE